MSEENHFPFGMDPSEERIANTVEKVRKVYEGCPPTICNHRAECCQAGMPNMYAGEFISLRRGAIDKMSKKDRTDLTVECIRRYLYNQKKPKPCAFLKDSMCGVYEFRPLKCRLYGLIPDSMYDRVANSVAKEMGVPREEVPLCNQCPFVKVKPEFQDRYPDGKIPEKEIKKMEKTMREYDRSLGMKKELQDQGFSFLTYHDWHLLFEFGEEWMEKLTKLRLNLKDEEKEQFISSLKIALEKKANEEEIENAK